MNIRRSDVAGRIEAVGTNVKKLRPEDEVYGDFSRSGYGGFAEYVRASEDALVSKPPGLSFGEAAGTP